MTSNNLTEERINGLLNQYDEQGFNDASDAELMAALRELQQRRAADKNYFLYGIADPEGRAHVDEFCVSIDLGEMQAAADELNQNEGTGGYRAVALYTALPLTGDERQELQQYRKAESADREMLKRLAVILSGSDAPGEIRALTVTAQSFVDRCKLLAKERDKYGR